MREVRVSEHSRGRRDGEGPTLRSMAERGRTHGAGESDADKRIAGARRAHTALAERSVRRASIG